MTFHRVFELDGAFFALADPLENAFGQVQVLKVLQVFEDSLAGVICLGSSGAPGETL
jgi:hypothetical protein